MATAGVKNGTSDVICKAQATEAIQKGVPQQASTMMPLLAMVAAAAIFALNALVVRKLTLSGISALQVLFIRGFCQAFGAVCTLIYMKRDMRKWLGEQLIEVKLLSVRGVLGFLNTGFAFLAVAALPLVDSQIIGQIVPIFAAMFAFLLLGEPWHTSEKFSVLCAIIGVTLIARPHEIFFDALTTDGAIQVKQESTDGSPESRLLGIAFGIVSAAFNGFLFIILRLLGTKVKVHWSVVQLYQSFGQILFSPLALFVMHQPLRGMVPWQFWCTLFCGLLGFVGQAALTYGAQHEKSASSSLVRQGMSPLFALALQIIFLPGDPLLGTTFAGFIVIAIGMATVFVAKATRDRKSVV